MICVLSTVKRENLQLAYFDQLLTVVENCGSQIYFRPQTVLLLSITINYLRHLAFKDCLNFRIRSMHYLIVSLFLNVKHLL